MGKEGRKEGRNKEWKKRRSKAEKSGISVRMGKMRVKRKKRTQWIKNCGPGEKREIAKGGMQEIKSGEAVSKMRSKEERE